MRAGELGHDQAAAAQIADKAAKDGVGYAGHGGKNRCRGNGQWTNLKFCREVQKSYNPLYFTGKRGLMYLNS